MQKSKSFLAGPLVASGWWRVASWPPISLSPIRIHRYPKTLTPDTSHPGSYQALPASVAFLSSVASAQEDERGLVILKPSHPRRPVLRLDSAGHGPGTGRIKLPTPLQRPQLFKAHLPDRPIKKDSIDMTVVPVQTKRTHPPRNTTVRP